MSDNKNMFDKNKSTLILHGFLPSFNDSYLVVPITACYLAPECSDPGVFVQVDYKYDYFLPSSVFINLTISSMDPDQFNNYNQYDFDMINFIPSIYSVKL